MFQYYRFIGQNIANCLPLIEQQAELAGWHIRYLEEVHGVSEQDDENRITIVTEDSVIIDIFRG